MKVLIRISNKIPKSTKRDTRGLPMVAELSVDPSRANPGERWEEFHRGLAEGGPIPRGFPTGIGIRIHCRRIDPSGEPL